MRPLREWQFQPDAAQRSTFHIETARSGAPTLKAGAIYLHSRYDPRREAEQLVESAALDPARPVLVAGLGLGYHLGVLADRGFEVAVIEPEAAVAALARAHGTVPEEVSLGLGTAATWADTPAFLSLARRNPQILAHPATTRLHPELVAEIECALARAALRGTRFNIAVVGPMYGGSLPIAGYLADAFQELGHSVLRVDNDAMWDVYRQATKGLRDPRASAHLGNMAANFLSEWSYARVAEFDPEICIVLAQAPVNRNFPARLRKHGIVSAFWFVENWRHLHYWRDIAPQYDCFFHIQPGEFEDRLREAGCAHTAYLPTGCDPRRHRPVVLSNEEQKTYDCDISFAGAGYYNRRQVFKGLTDYRFKIWGVDWHERELARLVVSGNRRFDNELFMKIVAGSKINLNLHSSNATDGVDPNCDAINPRVFEIAAAGGFQLCDPCKGLEQFFDLKREIPTYRNLRELRDCIDHYLNRPEERHAAATAARARALAEHTYTRRAQQMLDSILAAHAVRIQRKGVRIQRSVAEMFEKIGQDTELGAWLRTLPPDTPFTLDRLAACAARPEHHGARPARIFRYMREVRDFAETMLREMR